MLLLARVVPQQVVLKIRVYYKMLWNESSVMIPQKGWIGKGKSPKFGLNLKILSFGVIAQNGSPPSQREEEGGERG
jgi:hypothetical protein